MKDSEFIELLNLYLDHEISAADAARLEAEVLANPARRTIYQDYCRMQKACKVLAKDFVDEGVPAAARNVVAFESARTGSRGFWVATGAFAAVAACLAVVFVQETRQPAVTPQEPTVAATEVDVKITPAARNADRTIPSTVSLPAGSDQPQAMLVTAISLAGDRQRATPLMVTSEQPAPQFDWMNTVQLSPVQRASLDEFRFDNRAGVRGDTRPYMKRPAGQGPTEFNALRWEKR